ncbi:hypothetical protein EVAR_25718_1 [Eumeta japonica]|uniref:Uncharacterized protein n=1 Tax=Eumeta variegata TaxID=151549 RepID=A0A4C1YU00_EUMVA|nr:hypothetical protein EVAR_25718_1 [Eumeta japonica]
MNCGIARASDGAVCLPRKSGVDTALSASVGLSHCGSHKVLLSRALVKLYDRYNKKHIARALLDKVAHKYLERCAASFDSEKLKSTTALVADDDLPMETSLNGKRCKQKRTKHVTSGAAFRCLGYLPTLFVRHFSITTRRAAPDGTAPSAQHYPFTISVGIGHPIKSKWLMVGEGGDGEGSVSQNLHSPVGRQQWELVLHGETNIPAFLLALVNGRAISFQGTAVPKRTPLVSILTLRGNQRDGWRTSSSLKPPIPRYAGTEIPSSRPQYDWTARDKLGEGFPGNASTLLG